MAFPYIRCGAFWFASWRASCDKSDFAYCQYLDIVFRTLQNDWMPVEKRSGCGTLCDSSSSCRSSCSSSSKKRYSQHIFWIYGDMELLSLSQAAKPIYLFVIVDIIWFQPDVEANAGYASLCSLAFGLLAVEKIPKRAEDEERRRQVQQQSKDTSVYKGKSSFIYINSHFLYHNTHCPKEWRGSAIFGSISDIRQSRQCDSRV